MKTFLKFLFYRGFCPFLLFLGLDKLWRTLSKNRRLIIMYHGVSRDNSFAINGRHLPAAQFEKQLRYFKRNFNIVPLTDLCDAQLKGILPEKHTIALTFDDGYLNNISNALPLLKKYQIPATIFISSVSLETRDYIQPTDYLDLINYSIAETVAINGKIFRKDRYHLVDANEKKSNVYQYINSLDLSSWTKTFSDLQLRYPYKEVTRHVKDETYSLITSSALTALFRSDLITIGSHGHWHVNLSVLSDTEIKDQLGTSKGIFSRHCRKPVEILAFPYGYFNEMVLSVSRNLGYRYLIAGGSVEPEYRADVFPRIGILNLAGYAYNILSVNRGFGRFGF
ncbi:MAG TPA: polysaccharide deacetylase family protein [Flavitalea sp.]|nr:polysaccharide deacetylase family protein [Flavitalea sp.]